MMEKLSFWKGGDASGSVFATGRLMGKRMIARIVCALAFAVLVYHVFTSVELRKSFNERVTPIIEQGKQSLAGSAGYCPNTQGNSSVPLLQKDKKQIGKEKATLLMLVRNRELRDALSSMRAIEDRFNKNFHYPWTFMNDKPFTDEFIRYTTGMASGPVEYAVIPENHWSVPERINKTLMEEKMQELSREGVIYGGSPSYRHMCRFNSGFFYDQEVLQKYDWYWRVEPKIEFWCDINYDPFTFMRENNKIYGFVITMYEIVKTVPTLWARTREFVAKNPQYLAINNSKNWLVDNTNPTQPGDVTVDGEYNYCHFWSNFEIASLSFYRSEAYRKYFEFLDNAGGFFYERWGDAPVHSIALSLFAPHDQIHHFSDIGYNHEPAARCPQDDESHEGGRCYCNRGINFDLDNYSCTKRWFDFNGYGKGAIYPGH